MIVLDRVSFCYPCDTPGPVAALTDVSLAVRASECLGIAGPSGSGKSTLLALMAGLEEPASGSVRIEGRDPRDRYWAREPLSTRVGLLFQFPERQLFEETVADDVAFGPRNLGLGGREVEARVREALERVDLDPSLYGPRSPFSLSFGEARRAALAGVLALRPRALLLDEPTAGLDLAGEAVLLALLHSLRGEGVAVVVSSHDATLLAELADQVVVLGEGRVRGRGPAAEVFGPAVDLDALGLERPFAAEVLGALAGGGRAASLRLEDVAETLATARRGGGRAS